MATMGMRTWMAPRNPECLRGIVGVWQVFGLEVEETEEVELVDLGCGKAEERKEGLTKLGRVYHRF